MRASPLWALPIACVAYLSAAQAADGGINLAKSSVIATFRQENVPVEATFKSFNGTIDYDAAKPAATSAAVTIDVSSLDIGDESYNAEVRKAAWFDSAHFPQATFRSTAIKTGAAGHFDATGTLTIKGKPQTITVPITAQHVGDTTTFDGSFEVSRKAFGIGDPSWDDVLEDKVLVRFHLQGAAAVTPAAPAAPAQSSRS
jgi:polyisoprenoid-binding protein YceI